MNPTVSIIIPVYNAEKQLARCIDSVLNQEYSDFELLLIEDGSTDSSGAICDLYAGQDSRVTVVHKENSGVSDSRNLGISMARGTYLQFLDSDDWITPDATNLLVRAADEHSCDLVISDFYRVVGNRVSRKGIIDEDVVLSREEFASYMMDNPADFYYGVLWNKLYRREIIVKHQLQMNKNISWCEDFMFNLEYIRYAETFYALQVPIYYYVKTKGSLATKSMGLTRMIKMKLTVFEYYTQFYQSIFDEEEYQKSRLKVYRFLIDIASDGNVPPLVIPGTKKLGSERTSAALNTLDGDGFLMDAFRSRKLLEYYIEPVALKHDLTLTDALLLLHLTQLSDTTTWKKLSDFTSIPRSTLMLSLQKLNARDWIRIDDASESSANAERQVDISFTDSAQTILADLDTAQNDYEQARMADFSEEEMAQYFALSAKIQQNTQKILH
ncbi:MAG: glycosyltransferase [Butyricicoccaceae bacterium]